MSHLFVLEYFHNFIVQIIIKKIQLQQSPIQSFYVTQHKIIILLSYFIVNLSLNLQ